MQVVDLNATAAAVEAMRSERSAVTRAAGAIGAATTGDGEGEDAVAANASAAAAAEGAPLEEGPRWPDEAAEAAFLSEQRTAGGTGALSAVRGTAEKAQAEVDTSPLPPLQTLVDRLSGETREVLEDLFRAKFVSVKKVSPEVLKGS